uniref:Uncharacterized protein n=1 Tax=Fagus sylvatica TaxID=28930 RepID=A0A2N9GRD0_FAGSY
MRKRDDEEEDEPTAELSYLDPHFETDPGSISEWELDFCSRPILDIRGKKLVWELVDAIVSISDDLGVPLPEKIRL